MNLDLAGLDVHHGAVHHGQAATRLSQLFEVHVAIQASGRSRSRTEVVQVEQAEILISGIRRTDGNR